MFNIYDILIVFVGGLVGVIVIICKEKGNFILGVVIVMVLLLFLCIVGFGIVVGNWKFFVGVMYFYVVNCVFICVFMFLIVKLF